MTSAHLSVSNTRNGDLQADTYTGRQDCLGTAPPLTMKAHQALNLAAASIPGPAGHGISVTHDTESKARFIRGPPPSPRIQAALKDGCTQPSSG